MMNKSQSISPKTDFRVALHYWGRRGGGSQVTLHLARHLVSRTSDLKVFLALAQHNSEMNRFRASGLHILSFSRPDLRNLWRKAWALPRELSRQADAMAALKPDAVIMTMNSPFAWPFIHLLRRRQLRVIYVAHDAEPHPGDYAQLWQRVTQALLIKNADRVVALSGNVSRRLAERDPASASKTSTIPLEAFYPTRRSLLSERRSTEGPVRLLFYGRLLPYKGLDLLIQALGPLKGDSRWRLTLAGSGPLESEVRRAFAEWPQVDLELGWIPDQRMDELFSSHHLLLCPYKEASQSGVIAEALSWALPSLVMPAGALPEQIGYGIAGLVARTGDAEGFRDALTSVLDAPEVLAPLSQGSVALLAERQSQDDWLKLIKATAHR